jgi:hypothetical protein
MKGKLLFLTIFSVFNGNLNAQITNTAFIDSVGGEKVGKLSISGWMDAYYAKSNMFNVHQNNYALFIPKLVSNTNYNMVDINLAYVDFRYVTDRLKIRLVPAFGSYMDKNYDGFSSLNNLMEGSLGVKLWKKKDVWIEAGLIGSPFTNENPVSREHIMYTRSLAAEFSPYYLTGAKITSPITKRIKGSLYLLNGWQNINKDATTPPAYASQIEFNINNNNLINWNVYYQERLTDTRLFSDIYWIGTHGKWKFTSCLYAGNDEKKAPFAIPPTHLFQRQKFWCTANFATSYEIASNTNLSARVEYFQDRFNFVEGRVFGAAIGVNRKLFNQLYWRTECKLWQIDLFFSGTNRNIMSAITSLGLGF